MGLKLDQDLSSRQRYNRGTLFLKKRRFGPQDVRVRPTYYIYIYIAHTRLLSTEKNTIPNIRFQFQTFQSLKRSPRENNNGFYVIGDDTTYSRTINVRAINIGVHNNNNIYMRFDNAFYGYWRILQCGVVATLLAKRSKTKSKSYFYYYYNIVPT